MKAVMWTDVFQVSMMVMGLLAIIIHGTINQGGPTNIWATAQSGGRVNFLDFDPNPGERHTFWSLVFGGFFTWLAIYGVNQAQVQRTLTCPNLRAAQIAMLLNGPGLIFLMILASSCGLIVYAHFQTCDPITNKNIFARDQLLPFYVMDAMHHLMGVPGLFIACIFSGALSTVSSGLNSLAAVTIEDFVRGYFRPNISEKRATIMAKLIALGYGVLMILLTVVASQLGGVLQAALGLFGMIGGPLLGVFTLGMFFPWANWKGALVGTLIGFCFQFWIGIGAIVYRPITESLPMSTAGCSNVTTDFFSNVTLLSDIISYTVNTTVSPVAERPAVAALYSLSYLWYSFVAVLTVCCVGLLTSLITGASDPSDVDARAIVPVFRYIFWWASPETKDRFNQREIPKVERTELAEHPLCGRNSARTRDDETHPQLLTTST